MNTLFAPDIPELYDKHVYEEFGLEVIYPETDGQPMAESDYQLEPLIYFLYTLKAFFASQPDVYVVGDMLLYYEEGAPKLSVAPDVFVTRGVGKHKRPSFKLWEEATPCFVLEILSPSTAIKDQVMKRGLYERLGIQEYVIYDPIGNLADEPLEGYRLEDGAYQPIPFIKQHGQHNGFAPQTIFTLNSVELGLQLHWFAEDGEVAFFDPKRNRYLLHYNEQEDQIVKQEKRIVKQKERIEQQGEHIDQIEQENEVLKAKLRELGHDI